MESYEEAIKYFDKAIDVDKFYLGVYYLKGKFKYFQFRNRIIKIKRFSVCNFEF